jgi:peptide/nickel transport system permease protein
MTVLNAAGRLGKTGAPNLITWFRSPLVHVVTRRLGLALPLMFVVSGLTFLLVSLSPGDPTHQILGTTATRQEYAELRRNLGLDLPLYEQYWRWLRRALAGDLGVSLFSQQSVSEMIGQRFPVTLSLLVGSLVVTLVLGIGIGVFSALRGGALGRLVDGVALVGFSLPAFWLGAELIVLFSVKLNWLPATGYVPISQSPVEWARSLVLPVFALSLYGIAATAKQTREAMLDVLASEHIRMARANGMSRGSVTFRHALRNASMPVATVLGVIAVGLLGGTVLVETVFALPGLGSLMVTAAIQHDLPVVVGMAVYFTFMVVVINLVIDLAYAWLDPRVRVR